MKNKFLNYFYNKFNKYLPLKSELKRLSQSIKFIMDSKEVISKKLHNSIPWFLHISISDDDRFYSLNNYIDDFNSEEIENNYIKFNLTKYSMFLELNNAVLSEKYKILKEFCGVLEKYRHGIDGVVLSIHKDMVTNKNTTPFLEKIVQIKKLINVLSYETGFFVPTYIRFTGFDDLEDIFYENKINFSSIFSFECQSLNFESLVFKNNFNHKIVETLNSTMGISDYKMENFILYLNELKSVADCLLTDFNCLFDNSFYFDKIYVKNICFTGRAKDSISAIHFIDNTLPLMVLDKSYFLFKTQKISHFFKKYIFVIIFSLFFIVLILFLTYGFTFLVNNKNIQNQNMAYIKENQYFPEKIIKLQQLDRSLKEIEKVSQIWYFFVSANFKEDFYKVQKEKEIKTFEDYFEPSFEKYLNSQVAINDEKSNIFLYLYSVKLMNSIHLINILLKTSNVDNSVVIPVDLTLELLDHNFNSIYNKIYIEFLKSKSKADLVIYKSKLQKKLTELGLDINNFSVFVNYVSNLKIEKLNSSLVFNYPLIFQNKGKNILLSLLDSYQEAFDSSSIVENKVMNFKNYLLNEKISYFENLVKKINLSSIDNKNILYSKIDSESYFNLIKLIGTEFGKDNFEVLPFWINLCVMFKKTDGFLNYEIIPNSEDTILYKLILQYRLSLRDLQNISTEEKINLLDNFLETKKYFQNNPTSNLKKIESSLAKIKEYSALNDQKNIENFLILIQIQYQQILNTFLNKTACYINSQWESAVLSNSSKFLTSVNFIDHLFGVNGMIWSFAQNYLADFAEFKEGEFLSNVHMNNKISFTNEFVSFMEEGKSAQSYGSSLNSIRNMNFNNTNNIVNQELKTIKLKLFPLTLNSESKIQVKGYQIELNCINGSSVLKFTEKTIKEGMFTYSQSQCLVLKISIFFEHFTLEKNYFGLDGFLEFNNDFKFNEHVFSKNDFPEHVTEFEQNKISSINIKIEKHDLNSKNNFSFDSSLKNIPKKIAECH